MGFGTFQQLLAEFPAEKLHETIPNFHNTPDRYRAFLETLERDPMRRAAQVQPEIEFALARQSEMAALQTALMLWVWNLMAGLRRGDRRGGRA